MHIGGRLVGGLFGSWLLLLARAASVSALLVEPPGPRGKKPAPGSLRVFAQDTFFSFARLLRGTVVVCSSTSITGG